MKTAFAQGRELPRAVEARILTAASGESRALMGNRSLAEARSQL
jgi:hypothetical protein